MHNVLENWIVSNEVWCSLTPFETISVLETTVPFHSKYYALHLQGRERER